MVQHEGFKPAPIKPTVSYNVLQQLDVRVGKIEAVEDIPKSDKLVKLVVDFGDHTRLWFQPRRSPEDSRDLMIFSI